MKYHTTTPEVKTRVTDSAAQRSYNGISMYESWGFLIEGTTKELYGSIEFFKGVGLGWVIDYLVRLVTGIFNFWL